MNALIAGRPRCRYLLPIAAVAALCCVAETAAAQIISISRADCARLVAHNPAPDVEYRPGVDVRGRPVATADVAGTPKLTMPDAVEIPVQLDLLQRLGLPANSRLYKLDDVTVGNAWVRIRDGRAWFNGTPLTSEEQHVMARACQKMGPAAVPFTGGNAPVH